MQSKSIYIRRIAQQQLRASQCCHLHRRIATIPLSNRTRPPSEAYQTISSVELDIEAFNDESTEKSRSVPELQSYLSDLSAYLEKRKSARPQRHEGDLPFKPLYPYKGTETTEVDQRPPYIKFMEYLKEENNSLYEDLRQPIALGDVIDMSYLALYDTKPAPPILNDDEYPDWVWELAPESRAYDMTDLVQTPFENLSETEKTDLIKSWYRTKRLADSLWVASELGKYGKVRPKYNDPWPSPITKMDIWESDLKAQISNELKGIDSNDSIDSDESGAHQLEKSKREGYVLEKVNDSEKEIDLVKYYGMQDVNTNIDNQHIMQNVVYTIKRKS